jgi:NAD(P)-dependent dehydrogenase (short-subunit alcohol dehydrogenase family)
VYRFASKGFKVALIGASEVESVAQKIKEEEGEAQVFQVDVTNAEAVKQAFGKFPSSTVLTRQQL